MPPKCRILFCTEISPLNNYEGTFELECVSGPLKCLSLVTNCIYDTIIVDFSRCDPIKRGLLFDLCVELKGNALTRGIKVIAILAGQDCPGLDKLHCAGIDLVFPVLEVQGEPYSSPVDLIKVMDAARQPQALLAQLCPLIGYDPGNGITFCKAHGDRLVLGGQRLARLCCAREHVTCEFFLKPRIASKPESDDYSDRRTKTGHLCPLHAGVERYNGV